MPGPYAFDVLFTLHAVLKICGPPSGQAWAWGGAARQSDGNNKKHPGWGPGRGSWPGPGPDPGVRFLFDFM